jgi:hypothetical protein
MLSAAAECGLSQCDGVVEGTRAINAGQKLYG